MSNEQTRYLDEAATARELNVSQRTLQRWRRDGGGPSYCRLGLRRIGYDTRDIAAWTAASTFASRAAELAGHVGAVGGRRA